MSSNQKIIPWIFLLGGMTVTVASLAGRAQANESFTFAVLPDTQNYTKLSSNYPLFSQQTQWIADQIQLEGNPRNIQFVSHLGDIVNFGDSQTQWQVAEEAIGVLDGVVKYAVLPGNHDYQAVNQKISGTANYLSRFGPQRFAGEDWYGGADPSGNNSFQRFSAGGYDFIHLALEWRPTDNTPYRATSPIEWAQSVIDANPHTPVVLSTHENLVDVPPTRSSFGDDLWDQLVRRNDQIFMVLNGHFQSGEGFNDGEYHQISTNDAGRPVFELLQNYQDYPRGGEGWLRLLNFDIPNNQIAVETYSPVLDQYQTERVTAVGQYASQFELPINFPSRLAPLIIPPTPDFSFRQGVNNYFGTIDKEIRASGNDQSNGQNVAISVDGNDGSSGQQPNQGLIRFEDFFGNGSGQLPLDARIDHAELVFEVFNAGSGFTLHEMLMDWDENSTWQGLGNGVQADGVEASANVLAVLGTANNGLNVPVGRLEIDVTAAVESYLEGTLANNGWVLMPFDNGDNGIDFFTSEFAGVNLRPTLNIFLSEPPAPGDFDQDGQVDGNDFLFWQRGNLTNATGASALASWSANYGLVNSPHSTFSTAVTVPEPAACTGLLVAIAVVVAYRRGGAFRRGS